MLSENRRFYKRDHLFLVKLDTNGNVVHLHGCIDDPDGMVTTTKDYLDRYSPSRLQIIHA